MSIFDRYIVNQEIKTLLKVYPDCVRLYKFATPKYVRRFDLNERRPYNGEKRKIKQFSDEDYELQSLYRAKSKFVDLCLSNHFDQFATFTFKENREDIDAKKKQMAFWLNNQRNTYGKFYYLIVPEYHKDNKSIHFHALLKSYKGILVPACKQTPKNANYCNLKHDHQLIYVNGRQSFNVKSYQAGFSQSVIIDDLAKTAGYVGKYMTKDMPKFKGKQRYWRSNGLKMPLKIINPLLNAEDLQMFNSIHKDKSVEVFEVRGQINDNDLARIADYGKQRYDDLYVSE